MWYGRGKLPLVKKLSQRGDVIEIELYSSQEALKILAQLYGMLKEWVEHTGRWPRCRSICRYWARGRGNGCQRINGSCRCHWRRWVGPAGVQGCKGAGVKR